jgi:hypothetical protein
MRRYRTLSLVLFLFMAGCAGEPAAVAPAPTEPVATSLPIETPPASTPAPTDTIAPTTTPAPTLRPLPDTLAAEGLFDVYQDRPIVPHGPAGSWDAQFTDPGAAVYHDGLYHMFHNGFVGWPAPVGVAYSTSADGFQWTRVQEEPVFVGDDLAYVGLTALASSALVEDDGAWVLYFYTWDENRWPAATKIGRATAPAPQGPWTADAEPVLLQGSAGEWDDYAVRAPSVVRTAEGYIMFYSGYTRQQGRIGLATSADGIHWTKYDDPATAEAPYAASDPVFLPGETGAWDRGHVFQPRVAATAEGFVMLYSAAPSVNGSGGRLGYAISPDGLKWARSEGPILEAGDVSGGRAIWFTEFLHQDDTYFLFFELGTGGETEVYLATHEGALLP